MFGFHKNIQFVVSGRAKECGGIITSEESNENGCFGLTYLSLGLTNTDRQISTFADHCHSQI